MPRPTQHPKKTSRPMSGTDRRASTTNLHLDAILRSRLQALDKERRHQSHVTQRRISDLQLELRNQGVTTTQSLRRHSDVRPWSTMTYQRRAAALRREIEKKEEEREYLGHGFGVKVSVVQFGFNGRLKLNRIETLKIRTFF